MAILFPIYLALSQLVHVRTTSEEVPFSKYRDILTRNYSKRWILHMTERQSNSNPYCNLCCLNITGNGVLKDCGFHTLCRYKKGVSRPHCRGFMSVKFTEGEKYMILDAHNTVRNKVASGAEQRGAKGAQPSAANMRRLEWDEELAVIAEVWASQCSPTHDRCRDVERFPVGQNIVMDAASKSNHLGFILNWYNKVAKFNAATLSSYSPTTHATFEDYTQLVWAESYRIGCARAVFQPEGGPDVVYKEILVCNYGPSGNIPGQPVYIRGSPCSACHFGTKCESEYPSLCGRSSTNTETSYRRTTEMSQKEDLKKAGSRKESLEDMEVVDPKKNYNGNVKLFNYMPKIYTSLSPVFLYYILYV